jgi:hypothetical protein
MTARGIRIALLISGRIARADERTDRLRTCLAEGMRLATCES